LEAASMTFSPASPPTPPRRFPRWLIAVLALGSLVTLAFCAIMVIGMLTLLGSKVTPTTSVARGGTAQMIYDPRANPNAAIDEALKAAKTDHKRVLLDFGADWCPDCQVLAQLFEDPKVKPFLDAHYHVVRIDVGRWDNNLDVAKRYGNPIEKGIPAVVILDADANTITSTAGGELANARTASANDILTFIQQSAGSK
jgi:thiol:disulfide interchange protein